MARKPFILNLDRSSPKEVMERHQGSILAYGLMNQNAHGIGFNVAFGENLDPDVEDCVIRYKHEKIVHTFPVQLKRVTPRRHGPPRRVEPPDRRVGEVPDRTT